MPWMACGTFASAVFFQAEDGIRAATVTGVQTCALPISRRAGRSGTGPRTRPPRRVAARAPGNYEIGRASCRERVEVSVGAGAGTRKNVQDDGHFARGGESNRHRASRLAEHGPTGVSGAG